ncbi:MAG: carbamoyltransferase C-terminal domain-containing protein [Chitinophagales bacterium]
MYILGINGGFGGGYQDGCACLYADGKIMAAVEEERLNKIKFSTGIFPLLSIKEVLSLANISMQDISIVAFHGVTWQGNIEEDIRNFLLHHFGYCPTIKRFHHHNAHAASSFYLSGFDEALVFTMDNSGDGISSQIMLGKNGKLELVKNWERPISFGAFYSAITQLAGFNRDADEYKLMGLAPFGNPDAYDFSDFLFYTTDGNYELNKNYIYPVEQGKSFPNKQIPLYSDALLQKLEIENSCAIRNTQIQKDLAASAQKQLEKTVIEWINFWIKKTGVKNICLAGGVAMNCVLNQKIAENTETEQLFITPFSGDQGVSIGNAFLAGIENNIVPNNKSFAAYSGRCYSVEEVEIILEQNKISFRKTDNHIDLAARYIADGKIIGWFQGNSEIGARALGNRSILANPAIKGMKDKINKSIKFRASFRPFCPSVLEEDFAVYFESKLPDLPYMNRTVNCKEITQKELTEIVHIDKTARIQTVSSENNAIFHQLLIQLKKHTGHGVVLNTSLNIRNQPMAYDINDALTALFTSGLDALFIEHILIEK